SRRRHTSFSRDWSSDVCSSDLKENSEHVMLVDLARNDLSRHGNNVKVEKYREVQFFSHVIHLVSKVTGTKHKNTTTMQVVADTRSEERRVGTESGTRCARR